MTVALVLTAFTFGLRHGIDWDHIAAIADLSSTAENRRRGLVLSFIYAVGHGVVVFALGVGAIVLGVSLPDGVDDWMGRFVGLTLVLLGVWILIDLVRSGRDFRLRSRWILILAGTFAGLRRVRDAARRRIVTVDHDHHHDHDEGPAHAEVSAHDHAHVTAEVAAPDLVASGASQSAAPQTAAPQNAAPKTDVRRVTGHGHSHRHQLALPGRQNASVGNGTAAGIGMLHGVGFESPTQIAIFVTSTAVVGATSGLVLLLAWIAGLIVANTALALAAAFGLLHAERHFWLYAALAATVALASVAMGGLLLFGIDALPALN